MLWTLFRLIFIFKNFQSKTMHKPKTKETSRRKGGKEFKNTSFQHKLCSGSAPTDII